MEPAISHRPPSRLRLQRRHFIAGTCVILGIAAFLVIWNNGLRDALIPKNFGVVEPGQLYRSGQISRWQIESTLRDNNIKVIVALSATGKERDMAAEKKAAADLGIDRELFPLGGDGTGQIEQYAAAIAAIDHAKKAGKPVLVHCVAGAQRTGGVIAMYQMLVEHHPAQDAYAQMREYGHDPHDNPQLLEYLKAHVAELARKLVDRHVIEAVPDPLPTLKAE